MVKYLKFEKKPNYIEWMVKNKKEQFLGDIAFQEKWKKFAFYPDESPYEHDIYLCSMCLMEIADFLDTLNFPRK